MPTLDLFIPHWNSANDALAPAPPINLGGIAVALWCLFPMLICGMSTLIGWLFRLLLDLFR